MYTEYLAVESRHSDVIIQRGLIGQSSEKLSCAENVLSSLGKDVTATLTMLQVS